MSGAHSRQADLSVLHPAVRERMQAVRDALHAEGFPFEIFEAFRTPQRQADLYAQGRTTSGPIVTKAPPWSSYHQYGLACDFVLYEGGRWSWDDKGSRAQGWKRLEAIGRQHGLEPLSFERPHLQLAGIDVDDLSAGHYPDGGDLAWAENLTAAVRSWAGRGAPPLPSGTFGRPALRGREGWSVPGERDAGSPVHVEQETDAGSLSRPAVPPETHAPKATAPASPVFARIQAQVDKWEGGYVDDPRDLGGATNRGITQATLSAWRGRSVSKEELKALTLAETWQIMKANYYDVVCGDDLPPAVAALAHNAAVLHGPGRSARFLQTALIQAGRSIKLDGAVGRRTLEAVQSTPVADVCAGFLRVEEAYLRSLSRFAIYGKGWMNRLDDFRTFSARLEREAPTAHGPADLDPGPITDRGRVPRQQPDPDPPLGPTPVPAGEGDVADLVTRMNQIVEMVLGGRPADGGKASAPLPADPAARLALITRVIERIARGVPPGPLEFRDVKVPDPKVLTPVNAALGDTIGKLLNGRKTGIGGIATLITVLLPQLEKLIPALGSLPGLAGAVPVLQPIFVALTLWGLLGKAEKWVTPPPTPPAQKP